jgi:sugar/nucleoside kinase (ribokinase family)
LDRRAYPHTCHAARWAPSPFYDRLHLEWARTPTSGRRRSRLSYAHTVLIGDEEMELLLGAGTCREGADLLRKEGVNLVVAKRGSQGPTAYSEAGEDDCPAFKGAVVSTAGAGDSFDAAFIAARQRAAGMHQALEYACAVAAIRLIRQGARSVPEHADVLAFLDEHRQTSSQSAQLS